MFNAKEPNMISTQEYFCIKILSTERKYEVERRSYKMIIKNWDDLPKLKKTLSLNIKKRLQQKDDILKFSDFKKNDNEGLDQYFLVFDIDGVDDEYMVQKDNNNYYLANEKDEFELMQTIELFFEVNSDIEVNKYEDLKNSFLMSIVPEIPPSICLGVPISNLNGIQNLQINNLFFDAKDDNKVNLDDEGAKLMPVRLQPVIDSKMERKTSSKNKTHENLLLEKSQVIKPKQPTPTSILLKNGIYFYEKNDMIFKGIFCNIYKGFHTETSKKIAIKKIKRKKINDRDPNSRARVFKLINDEVNSLKIIKKNSNAFIINIYDCFEQADGKWKPIDNDYDGGNLYIITEYCNQGNLEQH